VLFLPLARAQRIFPQGHLGRSMAVWQAHKTNPSAFRKVSYQSQRYDATETTNIIICVVRSPKSDRIGTRLRIPHEHTESKTKSQPRIWRDGSRNGRNQRADPNDQRTRSLPRSGERVGKVHVPAAPARPRREIRRARGDAEEEEEAAAAAATRRDAMAMDSFAVVVCLSLWFLGDGRRRGCKFLGSAEFIWAGLRWAVSGRNEPNILFIIRHVRFLRQTGLIPSSLVFIYMIFLVQKREFHI
jgi:hypothetical protein